MLPIAVSPYLGPASSLLSRLDAALRRIKGLEDAIVLDEYPAAGSNHFVSSGAVYAALQGKADLVDGVVPASQLPSYVDDIVEVDELPATGDSGKIYVRDGEAHRWTGSRFLRMGVQSDWDASESDDPAYIQHKPDIATMIADACRFLYTKPAGGIPKTDLASGVQAVLDDALTLSEVESGFSKWTWSDGVERGQPQFRHEDPLSSWSFYSVVSGADWYLAEESFTGNETQLVFEDPETGLRVVATRTKIGQTVDAALSDTSENPVQNKTIKAALDTKASVADMAARLARTEAVAGYTKWVWGDGEDRGQPVFDGDYWYVPLAGSTWTYGDATGDETRLVFYDDFDNEIVATRTKIRPTKTSELQNDSNFLTEHQSLVGYARTSDIPSLQGYAQKSEVSALSSYAFANVPASGALENRAINVVPGLVLGTPDGAALWTWSDAVAHGYCVWDGTNWTVPDFELRPNAYGDAFAVTVLSKSAEGPAPDYTDPDATINVTCMFDAVLEFSATIASIDPTIIDPQIGNYKITLTLSDGTSINAIVYPDNPDGTGAANIQTANVIAGGAEWTVNSVASPEAPVVGDTFQFQAYLSNPPLIETLHFRALPEGLTLTIPPATPGRVRDCLVRINIGTYGVGAVPSVTISGAASLEFPGGEPPEIDEGTNMLSITETAPGGTFAIAHKILSEAV